MCDSYLLVLLKNLSFKRIWVSIPHRGWATQTISFWCVVIKRQNEKGPFI